MNLSGKLESARLTTLDLVRAALIDESVSSVGDHALSDDDLYGFIDEVSAEITEFLGWHTLRAERTETYRLRRFARILTLDGPDPVVTEVKVATSPSEFATATAETLDDDVVVARGQNAILIERGLARVERYAQVTYTGGYFAAASEAGNHAWLSSAAAKQVAYRIQRAPTLGGNITQGDGGGTQFETGYRMLPSVLNSLRLHRRGGGL